MQASVLRIAGHCGQLQARKGSCLSLVSLSVCRYLVILKYGGIYADVDTDCARPMDELIVPGDGLLVGWEREYSDKRQQRRDNFVRASQV